jgi:TonB family protein
MYSGTWFVGVLLALNLTIAREQAASQQPNETRHGYVQCAIEKHPAPVPVFEHPCKPNPVGELKCGESVDVISRDGPWLKVRIPDGSERYLGILSVSQSNKKFLPMDLPVPSGRYTLDCSAFWKQPPAQPGTHPPKLLYDPEPEYSDKARRDHIEGIVVMSLTVGTDGMAHDVLVTKSVGHGLDEMAVATVKRWRFDPAAKDSKPIPARITVNVNFRFY